MSTEYAGDIDWAADDASGINTRARMEYGRIYRRVGTTYCSRCGVNSTQRSDLAAVLIRVDGNQWGHGLALCPEHLERWLEHQDGFTQAERQTRMGWHASEIVRLSREQLLVNVCSECFMQRAASGACECN